MRGQAAATPTVRSLRSHRNPTGQLFVTYKGLAATGFYTDWNHLEQNFFISNYEASQSVDNDDGSAYYNTSRNVMLYGGALARAGLAVTTGTFSLSRYRYSVKSPSSS